MIGTSSFYSKAPTFATRGFAGENSFLLFLCYGRNPSQYGMLHSHFLNPGLAPRYAILNDPHHGFYLSQVIKTQAFP